MRFINKLPRTLSAIACLLLIQTGSYAQDAAAAQPTTTSSTNQLVILLGFIGLILAFVIWGLGQVMITLGKQVLEKGKQSGKALSVLLMIGFSLLTLMGNAQDQAATEVAKVVPNYGGLDSTGFWILVTVLIVEVTIIGFMMFSIQRLQKELLPQQAAKQSTFSAVWAKLDRKFFTKAVSVEKEADVMLDHDYDGIRELDNALPPWWKYGFYITIFVAVIYLFNFHVFGYGKNPTQEYQAEMDKAARDKEAYEAKNKDKIDENNLTMPDAANINAGKEIFTAVCFACHGKQGEGGAGPNLTDDYWLHKGSLTDVYLSIKHGYPDKGMQAWEKNYSPKEILALAGFVKSLRGTNPPNPKGPQGDLFTETAAPATDSANAKPAAPSTADSSKTITTEKAK